MNQAKNPQEPDHIDSTTIGRIGDAFNLHLLPKLLNFLENHDSNTENQTRIMIAAGIVAVAKHLPIAARDAQITRLLTILSQILRSKSQEIRDLVRDSLSRIFLGPHIFPFCSESSEGHLYEDGNFMYSRTLLTRSSLILQAGIAPLASRPSTTVSMTLLI
jgi:hypothetical protein